MMLRVLDLFSGIGGFSLGLESTGGFEIVGHCEIEPLCQAVLAKHWPGVPLFGDVREVTRDELVQRCGSIDVVAGGPPCQPASVAGRRAGAADVRWLWPEFLRVVREVRPRWVVAENPLGIASLEPQGLDWICGELEAAGYEVWPVVVGAEHVGAPHRRHRVWVVAYSGERGRLAGLTRPHAGQPDAQGRGALAYSHGAGQSGQRSCGLLDGERAASGDDADGRGLGPVGEPTGGGLAELGRSDSGALAAASAQRWPARPGEPQHEWEAPRLAYGERCGRDGREAGKEGQQCDRPVAGRLQGERRSADGDRRDGEQATGSSEFPLGSAVDGLSERLVRAAERRARRANREALKAYGNAIVPQVAEVIGRAILAAEEMRVVQGS